MRSTPTVERLRGATAAGLLDPETGEALEEAYVFLLGLRLREQIRSLSEGLPAGNHVAVDALSPSERRHLKEAFLAVRTAQKDVVSRYQVVAA